jgi:hypothetical protein
MDSSSNFWNLSQGKFFPSESIKGEFFGKKVWKVNWEKYLPHSKEAYASLRSEIKNDDRL